MKSYALKLVFLTILPPTLCLALEISPAPRFKQLEEIVLWEHAKPAILAVPDAESLKKLASDNSFAKDVAVYQAKLQLEIKCRTLFGKGAQIEGLVLDSFKYLEKKSEHSEIWKASAAGLCVEGMP